MSATIQFRAILCPDSGPIDHHDLDYLGFRVKSVHEVMMPLPNKLKQKMRIIKKSESEKNLNFGINLGKKPNVLFWYILYNIY